MPHHEFSDEDLVIESDAELRALLKRLEPDPVDVSDLIRPDHHYLVNDIAEALGIEESVVAEQLLQMRLKHHEQRYAGLLKEFEEPLYRVERPDSSKEAKTDPLLRMKTARQLSDRVAEDLKLSVRKKQVDAYEEFGRKMAPILLLVMLTVIAAFVAYGAVLLQR